MRRRVYNQMTVTPSLSGRSRSRGFTSLEILIVVIILGILAGMIIPTLQKRAKQARLRAASSDLKELQEAMVRVAIDTRYYVPIHILDDTAVDPLDVIGPPAGQWNAANGDSIFLEDTNTNVVAARRTEIFIDPKTGDFVAAADNTRLYRRMIGEEGASPTIEQRMRALERFSFTPPYVSWNRDLDNDDMQDDPWGNPYLFFTQEGLVWDYNSRDPATREIQHQLTDQWDYTDFSGTGGANCENIFDRPVVLSMGPNGVPGDDFGTVNYNAFGTGDDIYLYFD